MTHAPTVSESLAFNPAAEAHETCQLQAHLLSFKLGCATSVNIWKGTVVYEELIINERQEKDKPFAAMLDCVRCGCPTDETLHTLEQRVMGFFGNLLKDRISIDRC